MYTAFPLTPESRKDLLWPCSLGGASGVFTCLSGAGGRAGRVWGFRATGGGVRTAGAAAAAHAGAHAGRLRRAAGHRRHPGCAFPPADKRSDMPHTAPHRCAQRQVLWLGNWALCGPSEYPLGRVVVSCFQSGKLLSNCVYQCGWWGSNALVCACGAADWLWN